MIKELEQKNTELERFGYTVSHDLKSPLITIKGFAGLLESDAQRGNPEQLRRDIHRISMAADTMQALLNDVLELSRVGRIISPPSRTPFGMIAKEAVDLMAGPLTERGVFVEIAPDLPVVNVDHARIREVLVNLLENAVKFLGDEPRPRIRIGAETDGEMPVFFVQDNGIGIDPRYLKRIFNLFEKLTPSMPGTGMGLPLVRRIIEVHGGTIWAESEGPGTGTTIRFTLPGELFPLKKQNTLKETGTTIRFTQPGEAGNKG
jgi:signal transduction histidine kinase